MNNFFRGIIAAWGAKKLGGGCFSTIVIFVVIYVLLGKCNEKSVAATRPANVKAHVMQATLSPAVTHTFSH
jgi:hypothetical protein